MCVEVWKEIFFWKKKHGKLFPENEKKEKKKPNDEENTFLPVWTFIDEKNKTTTWLLRDAAEGKKKENPTHFLVFFCFRNGTII